MTHITKIDPWLEPFAEHIDGRDAYLRDKANEILDGKTVAEFALGHLYFGLHKTDGGWVLREWAPNASAIHLVGDMTLWQEQPEFAFTALEHGVWELTLPAKALSHGQLHKLLIRWPGGVGYRIPSYANYVKQDEETKDFNTSVWMPETEFNWSDADFSPSTDPPLIYEAHVGMSGEKPDVTTYKEFTDNVLPRIKADGYNTVQLMAIQEHPYYGSFGYHVSNFFAVSSRFGTPDDF
ncbi:1,4-alpha-glucan-branching enzyme, partial [Candidatus Saccharibacteria bacterium]|nr:1,4-alpha-glucan-branching enzyme [Candidatus Saccharibacteria bacterium]